MRRQDEFIQAYYTTDVLYNKEVREYDQYVATARTKLDYYSVLSSWAAEFGKENVRVRVYDRRELHDGDVVAELVGRDGSGSAEGWLS